MLMLAHNEAEKLGGIYAFMDTDSIALVATKERREIEGVDQSGESFAIPVLSQSDVEEITTKFEQLNPYDRAIIKGSILKIEDENKSLKADEYALAMNAESHEFYTVQGDESELNPQLYCYAISSKRYALYNKLGNEYILRKASEHGLGAYLSPYVNDKENSWIQRFWLELVSGCQPDITELGKKPALIRLSMSTPYVMNWVKKYNERNDCGRSYSEAIKPYNFLTIPIVLSFFNEGKCPSLVAPYIDPDEALRVKFFDLHNPEKMYSIKTWDGEIGLYPDEIIVKSYKDILEEYPNSPEKKLIDQNGNPCGKSTIGVLHHPHITIGGIKYIGKEVNFLEEREAGLVKPQNLITVYEPDDWTVKWLPILRRIPTRAIIAGTGLSRSVIQYYKNGKRHPLIRTKDIVIKFLTKYCDSYK